MLSSTLRAITGSMTFKSKLPCVFATVTVTALPITWEQTMMSCSHMTGFTLPGMMDDPGCTAGSDSSPSPQRGPDDSQRMSLAIFSSEVATVDNWFASSTAAS